MSRSMAVVAAALVVLAALHVGGGRYPARSVERGLVRRQGLDHRWHEEDALLRRDALHQKHPRDVADSHR
ncbi:unnamed protein product [Urochloa humidicola]